MYVSIYVCIALHHTTKGQAGTGNRKERSHTRNIFGKRYHRDRRKKVWQGRPEEDHEKPSGDQEQQSIPSRNVVVHHIRNPHSERRKGAWHEKEGKRSADIDRNARGSCDADNSRLQQHRRRNHIPRRLRRGREHQPMCIWPARGNGRIRRKQR